MEHKTHQEDTVTIHWHDELLEIPKWIIEGYAEENISLDDKYLDELYSYRRPPIFSFQTEPEYNHVFTSLMIAKLNGIRAKKSLGKFVMYGSDGNKIATFDDLYEIILNENYRSNFLGYESSDKVNVYHAKVAKQRHLRGLIVVEPTEGAAMMLQELNDYKRNMFAWFYGVRAQKCFNDGHGNPLLSNYTFEEFRKQQCKAVSMEFYWALASSIRYNDDKTNRKKLPLGFPPLALYFELANCLYKLHQQNWPQVLICMSIHIAALPHKGFELFKQFFKCFFFTTLCTHQQFLKCNHIIYPPFRYESSHKRYADVC